MENQNNTLKIAPKMANPTPAHITYPKKESFDSSSIF